MSLELLPTLVCDGCGLRVTGPVERRFTRAHGAAAKLRRECELDGWMRLSRGRYHTEAHYCPNCKDRPIKPIKSTHRKRGPQPPPPPCKMWFP